METCIFIIIRPIVDVGDSLGLFARDSALSQGDTGRTWTLVKTHRVLGGQRAPVRLGGDIDRGQGQEEGGDQPRHHRGELDTARTKTRLKLTHLIMI